MAPLKAKGLLARVSHLPRPQHESKEKQMTKAEMVEGLKAGRVLIFDGWASDEDKRALADLHSDDLITAEWHESEQYSCWKVRWKQKPIGTFVEDASMCGD
jgi:hypothetical protein